MRLVILVGVLLAACSDGSSQGGSNAAENVAKVASKLGGACTSLTGTYSSDHPIQADYWTSAVGSNITITATAAGCSSVEYRLVMQPPGGGFAPVGDWVPGPYNHVWQTAGLSPGTYNIQILARGVGSSAQYEAYWGFTYVLLASPTCSSVSTSTSPIPYLAESFSMAAVGTQVTLSSTAVGCSPAEYRVVYLPPGASNWVDAAPWPTSASASNNATWTWDTAGKTPGVYNFQVWARAKGSPAEYEAYTGFSYQLQSTPLCSLMGTAFAPFHPNAASPWIASVGTQVTLTNTSTPCTASEYKIYHQRPNTTSWVLEHDYPANEPPASEADRGGTFVWNTTNEQPGVHVWQVWARGQGHSPVGYESYYYIYYTLLPNPMCDAVSFTTGPGTHAPVGSLVTLTPSVSSCPQPRYTYGVAPVGGAWRTLQSWTAGRPAHWNTLLEQPGGYYLQAVARNVDSTSVAYETYVGGFYTLDPVTPTHSISVTGGATHNCVLLASGQVGCWGTNTQGELGSGTTTSSSVPVATAGLIQAVSLGVGQSHACAVQYGGGVVCWGQNYQSQLGNGVNLVSTAPVPVTGLAGSASTVGVGAFHSCAALIDGTVQCWGNNASGQLGDGTQGNTRAAPVTVTSLPNDPVSGGAVQVVGGAGHTCALLGDGTVRCWGANDRGQLGNGGSSNSTSAVVVSGLGSVTSLSARSNATCAVKSDGTVWCWGDPTPYGVLGNSAVAPNYQRSPVQVAGITTARNVAVGSEHACASLQNNTAVCWGRNDQGQLGNGTTANSLSPVAVAIGGTPPTVASIGVGNASSCALIDGHKTTCWGNGVNGELGNGASVSSSTPVEVAPVPPWTACTGVTASASPASTTATVGDTVTITSTATGCAAPEYEVYRRNADQTWTRISSAYSSSNNSVAWNSTGATNGWQQLRVVARAIGSSQASQAESVFDYFLQSPDACNSLTITATPATNVASVGTPVTFTNTSTGCIGTPEYTIRHRQPDGTWHLDSAWSSANTSWVWDTSLEVSGWNTFEVMVRSQGSTLAQEEVRYYDYYLQPGPPRVSGGFWQFCELTATGTVGCWGLNSHGELGGNSTAFHSATPLAVQGLNYAVSLGVGWAHGCATVLGGGVKCWGQNQWNQLGNGSQVDSPIPVSVTGITNALRVAAGIAHSCAALADGTVKCWGSNTSGQLGDANPTSFSAPVSVVGITSAKQVSAGYYHSCALLNDGTVRCWGLNDKGQLGNGTTTNSLAPVQVTALTGVTQVATYSYQNCAVKSDHTIWCWGVNSPNGTLGDGTTTPHSTPVQVAGITNAKQVAITDYHACAALLDGTAKCWGLNDHGELGNNSTVSSFTPVPVSDLTNVSTVGVSEQASCAALTNGNVSCWGWGIEGNLGNGSYGSSNIPVTVGVVPPSSGGSSGSGGTGGSGGASSGGGTTSGEAGSGGVAQGGTAGSGATGNEGGSSGAGGGVASPCRDRALRIIDLQADFRDVWAGRETLASGKRTEQAPTITLRFDGHVDPAWVSGRVVGVTGGTSDAPTNCVNAEGNPVALEGFHQAVLVVDPGSGGLTDVVTVRPNGRLRAGCEYQLIIDALPMSDERTCLAVPFRQNFLVAADHRSRFDREMGSRRYSYDELPSVPVRFSARAGVNTDVNEMFDRYSDELLLRRGIDTMQPVATQVASRIHPGWQVQRFQQMYRGIPVLGYGYTVESEAGIFRSATGRVRPDINLSVVPILFGPQAAALAMASVNASAGSSQANSSTVSSSELLLRPQHVGDMPTELELVWRIAFSGLDDVAYVDVNANTGAVLSSQSRGARITACTGFDPASATLVRDELRALVVPFSSSRFLPVTDLSIGIWTQNGLTFESFDNTAPITIYSKFVFDPDPANLSGEKKLTEHVCWGTDDDTLQVANAHWATQLAANTFRGYLGWPGLTGPGREPAPLTIVVWDGRVASHFSPMEPGQDTDRIYMDKTEVFPGNVVHEFSHGALHYARERLGLSSFNYEGESGAIYEAFSDMMSAFTLYRLGGVSSDPWCLSTKGVACDRNMRSPKDSVSPRPDTYRAGPWNSATTECNQFNNDKCGVHENSTVLSHWFYLLAKGRSDGEAPNDLGCTVALPMLGEDSDAAILNAIKLAFESFATLDANASFIDARNATELAAEEIWGAEESRTVQKAWYAVGVGDAPAPRATSPEDGATDVEPWSTSFRFSVDSDAQGPWILRYSTDASFPDNPAVTGTVPVTETVEIDSIRYAVVSVALNAGKTYYWQAREGVVGTNSWAPCKLFTSHFTTSDKLIELTQPSAVQRGGYYETDYLGAVAWEFVKGATTCEAFVSEQDDGCDVPSAAWSAVAFPGSAPYYVGNSFDPQGQELLYLHPTLISPNQAFDPDITYYLYVRAVTGSGAATARGTCSRFPIRKRLLLPFNALAPLKYQTVPYGSGGPFTWTPASGADRYNIRTWRWSPDGQFEAVADETVDAMTAPLDLQGNIEYILKTPDATTLSGELLWEVFAVNASGDRREAWDPGAPHRTHDTRFWNASARITDGIADRGHFGMPLGDWTPVTIVLPINETSRETQVCFKVPANTVGMKYWFGPEGVSPSLDELQDVPLGQGSAGEYPLCTERLNLTEDRMVLAAAAYSSRAQDVPDGFGVTSDYILTVDHCGGVGDDCCQTSESCISGAVCRSGKCQACGKRDELCCSGDTCAQHELLSCGNVNGVGRCVPCGDVDQICCGTQAYLSEPANRLIGACNSQGLCEEHDNGVVVDYHCRACGGLDQPCCLIDRCNPAGVECDAGFCKATDPACGAATCPPVRRCNDEIHQGGNLSAEYRIEMGKANGSAVLWYNTHVIPDNIIVSYENSVVFETGCVGTTGFVGCGVGNVVCCDGNGQCAAVFRYGPGGSTKLQVRVEPNCSGTPDTEWDFHIDCPG